MSTRRRFPAVTTALLLAATTALAACDSGPSGPGTLEGTVTAPGASLGAVVIRVETGPGIGEIKGTGDTRAFAGVRNGGFQKVVLVSEGGGVTFGVDVDDLGGPIPTATVLSAVDTSNQPIGSVGGMQVRIALP